MFDQNDFDQLSSTFNIPRGPKRAGAPAKVKPEGVFLAVSVKGAASLYGMRRFPITLYADEWLWVIDHADEIRAFLYANSARLKYKSDWHLAVNDPADDEE